MMDDLSIQNLYLNFSKINPKSTQQGYPPWDALALIRVWPWIKLNIIGVIFQWYNLMVRTYLDCWKFSKIMDNLPIQNLYLNFFKINHKSTQQGYSPWGALALIRVWPWIKLGPKPRSHWFFSPNCKAAVLFSLHWWKCALCYNYMSLSHPVLISSLFLVLCKVDWSLIF